MSDTPGFHAAREGDCGEIVVFTIDRPHAKNALDLATILGLTQALQTTPDIRVAILTGAGDTFVSGGDLNELRGRDSREDAEHLSDVGYALTQSIAHASFPVIAAINGPAVGGGAELAVACDLRVSVPDPHIAFKQVNMGVTTSWGTAARLRELVGNGFATRLLYGLKIGQGRELFEHGLLDIASHRPRETAVNVAKEICQAPAAAIAATKRLLRANPAAAEIRTLERRLFTDTWSSQDHRVAVESWFARRG